MNGGILINPVTNVISMFDNILAVLVLTGSVDGKVGDSWREILNSTC